MAPLEGVKAQGRVLSAVLVEKVADAERLLDHREVLVLRVALVVVEVLVRQAQVEGRGQLSVIDALAKLFVGLVLQHLDMLKHMRLGALVGRHGHAHRRGRERECCAHGDSAQSTINS